MNQPIVQFKKSTEEYFVIIPKSWNNNYYDNTEIHVNNQTLLRSDELIDVIVTKEKPIIEVFKEREFETGIIKKRDSLQDLTLEEYTQKLFILDNKRKINHSFCDDEDEEYFDDFEDKIEYIKLKKGYEILKEKRMVWDSCFNYEVQEYYEVITDDKYSIPTRNIEDVDSQNYIFYSNKYFVDKLRQYLNKKDFREITEKYSSTRKNEYQIRNWNNEISLNIENKYEYFKVKYADNIILTKEEIEDTKIKIDNFISEQINSYLNREKTEIYDALKVVENLNKIKNSISYLDVKKASEASKNNIENNIDNLITLIKSELKKEV